VRDRLAAFDVPVFTNDIDFATNTVTYPHAGDRCDECTACGTCKPAVMRGASDRGRTTVFVGDGNSDRYAARAADVVFATKSLARWCANEGIAHTPFAALADVTAVLLPQV
jgi:2-hydroxy-3-keto-5-methylthiopentenyl-1-phosphate phosphatase